MSRPRPSRSTLAGAAALALGLAFLAWLWFLSPGAAAARAHHQAEERWEAMQPRSYSFDWTRCSGMCASCLLHVTVVDGQVVSAVGRDGDCSSYDVENAPTIEDTFATEESDRTGDNVASWDIEYDPTWGFPASVSIRCPDGWSDCGTSSAVTDFAPHP